MTNDRLKRAMDRGLSSIHLEDARRERMYRSIISQEEKGMNKAKKLSVTLVIAAAIMLMSFTVLAAQNRGWVNWKGEFIAAGPAPSPTPAPSELDRDSAGHYEQAQKMLRDVPTGEMWQVWADGSGWEKVSVDAKLTSLTELREKLEDLPLRIPREPKGWKVRSICMCFDHLKIVTEETPYSEETIEGVTLRKFRVKEIPAEAWEGYEVEMENEAGKRMCISAYVLKNDEGSPDILEIEDAEGHFPVDEKTSVEFLDLPDFDRAVMMNTEGIITLELQRDGKAADENGRECCWLEYYYIWSEGEFDAEELVR